MSSGMSTPTKAPKTMSSRLLTMKFMQRAAASPSPSVSTTDQHSPKRQKIGGPSPSEFDIESLVDQRAIRAALANEEAKRQSALERQAAEAGDTRWVLRFQDETGSTDLSKATLRVVQAGFSAIDGLQEGLSVARVEGQNVDHPTIVGRRSFGKFNRVIEKLRDPTAEDSSDSDSDSGSETTSKSASGNSDNDNPASALVISEREDALKKLKSQRKTKRKSEQAESYRFVEKRKDIKLNPLKSISAGGAPKKQACHICGEMSHLMAECPKRRRNEGGEHPRKPRKYN